MSSKNILVNNPDINVHNTAPQQITSVIPLASSKDAFVGRINLKSIQAINNGLFHDFDLFCVCI